MHVFKMVVTFIYAFYNYGHYRYIWTQFWNSNLAQTKDRHYIKSNYNIDCIKLFIQNFYEVSGVLYELFQIYAVGWWHDQKRADFILTDIRNFARVLKLQICCGYYNQCCRCFTLWITAKYRRQISFFVWFSGIWG